ncbi:MAG: TonB-dependent receptor, partial [Cyclobacteriaceae bacterium]
SDWLLKRIPNKALNRSSASFFDIGVGINHEMNSKNLFDLTAYTSNDKFKLNADTLYQYNNTNAALKWKHIFNDKFYGSFVASYSGYDYTFESEKVPVNAFTMSYRISQSNVKADFNYSPNAKHNIGFGVSSIYYDLSPGNFKPKGEESLVIPENLQKEQGFENVIYVGDQYAITPKLSVYGGIRFSLYDYLGQRDVYTYEANLPKTEENIIDTVSYGSRESIARYGAPEYRVSLNYALQNNSSIKFSYNRLRQYIQTLSNTTAISPTDIWKLSDSYIKPQVGDQFAVGYYKNLKGNTIETSVEAYYKSIENTLDYKGGAVLLLNHHIETDVVNAQGKSYGVELLIKKATGKINGWMSYTYSRSFLKTESEFTSETINDGKYYPSNYDKPHAVNF